MVEVNIRQEGCAKSRSEPGPRAMATVDFFLAPIDFYSLTSV
jgi:hypothetical protein